MKYEFTCECGESKEINVPLSEYYIPECDCGKTMNRVFSCHLSESCYTKFDK